MVRAIHAVNKTTLQEYVPKQQSLFGWWLMKLYFINECCETYYLVWKLQSITFVQIWHLVLWIRFLIQYRWILNELLVLYLIHMVRVQLISIWESLCIPEHDSYFHRTDTDCLRFLFRHFSVLIEHRNTNSVPVTYSIKYVYSNT